MKSRQIVMVVVLAGILGMALSGTAEARVLDTEVGPGNLGPDWFSRVASWVSSALEQVTFYFKTYEGASITSGG